ncbi:MAG: NADH-quinone oxidoreductase subunit N [Deltaproteobacteria bacterium]|nr:NADH-quinone oxidoreductase subunit N [Deltaproteobacteria bacterium]
MIPVPEINLGGILPALILCITGLIVMIAGLFIRKGAATTAALISLAGILIAFWANSPIRLLNKPAFGGLISLDPYSWFFNLLILISTGLTALMSVRYLYDEGLELYEYFVLLLFAAAGMMFMVSGTHILIIFVGLETLSISIYVLTGILPDNQKSSEAALKYLILGAFSSGIFLYGAALIYGAAGSLALPAMTKYFTAMPGYSMGMLGMGLLLAGFAFKVAAVPFHMWTPDVYEGAPAPLTGFMSVGVKAAAFAAFMRVFFEALSAIQINWAPILWGLAVLTMILGNLAALTQENIKRMLAYSSIAHAGYILVGMVAGKEAGTAAVLYYLLAYTFTNLGAFAVVALVGRKGEANVLIDDYRGLARVHPLLALVMSIFLFSLAGIPPTAGFVGKFTVFSAAINTGYIWLVIIGVLTSAASVFYYFRVIMKMYMEAPEIEPQKLQFGPLTVVALSVAVTAVLYIGIFPTTYLNVAVESVKPLF